MPYTKFEGHRPAGFGEEDFWRVFIIYGHDGHLGHMSHVIEQTFAPPSHWGSRWNLALIGTAVSEAKMFGECGQRTDDDGWTTEPAYTISSPMSLKAQIHELKTIRAATWQNQQNECAPSEDSDQPGHPSSLIRVFAVRMKKAWVLSYPLSE